MKQQKLVSPRTPWYEVELVEGEHGTCMFCGSPLLEKWELVCLPAPWLGYHDTTHHRYCPECHHLTPPPPGAWTPVGGGWLTPSEDTLRDRTERRLSGNWVV